MIPKAPRQLPKHFKRMNYSCTLIVANDVTIEMLERDMKELLEFNGITVYELEDGKAENIEK